MCVQDCYHRGLLTARAHQAICSNPSTPPVRLHPFSHAGWCLPFQPCRLQCRTERSSWHARQMGQKKGTDTAHICKVHSEREETSSSGRLCVIRLRNHPECAVSTVFPLYLHGARNSARERAFTKESPPLRTRLTMLSLFFFFWIYFFLCPNF